MTKLFARLVFMRLKLLGLSTVFLIVFIPQILFAQTLQSEVKGTWRAEVIEILSIKQETVRGTGVLSEIQTIRARILSGSESGREVILENDYLLLNVGDKFFLNYLKTVNGEEIFQVGEPDRRGVLVFFIFLFAVAVVWLGRWQGVRSLLALVASLAIIVWFLLPNLLAGYSPVLLSALSAGMILTAAIYLTHGFNQEATVALTSTIGAVVATSILAYVAVWMLQLSGFASDEAVYLNINTAGTLDFSGLLLGAIIIGMLGVLDDIAITQASVVSELKAVGESLSKKEIYSRAMRVGREHVGALVNTLVLAYTGAALPLLLLFSISLEAPSMILNREVFATEIIRTIVGSIGLILTVPLSTALSVYWPAKFKMKGAGAHHHHHH